NLAVVDVENSSFLRESPNLISVNGYSKDDPYNNYFLDGYEINPDWDLQYLNETTANMEYYINDDYGRFNASKMYRYTYTDYCVKPTENAIQFFAQQPYLHQGEDADGNRVNIAATGDLRGITGSMKYVEENMETLSTEGMSATEMKQFEQLAIYQEPKSSVYITTYLTSSSAMSNQIYLQSSNLAYLRYAEAINRAGKPSVALAVINNGLNLATLRDSLKVSSWELDSALVEKWSDQTFLANVGTRTRGQGVSTRVGFFFENANPNLSDSILFVEKVLLEECALETAFKGNRFHDLLRYTNHPDAPNYIADALAKKFPERAGEFASKSVEDWFIPYPHQPAE
ncbi:MAG: RagB/SusD family nutrient uptake outer membrane protein, partial [Bacteroidales bacterium]|nr:RagB/SusD family nutrient uptake outer membrane protein [Bacteroidales bacterium]